VPLDGPAAKLDATPSPVPSGTVTVVTTLSRPTEGVLHETVGSFHRPQGRRGPARRRRGPVAAPSPVAVEKIEARPMALDNRSRSPFGRGWHLQGLTRLVQPWCDEGRVTLAGGFEVPARTFGPSAELYLERLEQRLLDAKVPEQDLASAPLLAWAGGELYVGLQGGDHAEIWRVPAEGAAVRVAGAPTAPGGGPQGCNVAPLELYLATLPGLAPDPDGDGVLFASEDCVFHLKADGTLRS
jgi:hypothetical protein